jgi:hypothetical protein
MRSTQLNKALNIMKRTGDRMIVMGQETDDVSVMMSIESYERILNTTQTIGELSEDEMIDKINRDIALWRAHNESAVLSWYDGGMLKRRQSGEDDLGDFDHGGSWHDDNFDDFGVEDEDFDFENSLWHAEDGVTQDSLINNKEDIIPQFPNNFDEKWLDKKNETAEESLEDVPSEDEPRFYMEPIE